MLRVYAQLVALGRDLPVVHNQGDSSLAPTLHLVRVYDYVA